MRANNPVNTDASVSPVLFRWWWARAGYRERLGMNIDIEADYEP